MAFTTAQLVDIRRFMGYEAYGLGSSGEQNWRYFRIYGFNEFRLANLQPEEETVIITTYLANLYKLETAIVGASCNLATDTAAVWKHNANEVADRENLFASWRRKLCAFLGIPPGPGLCNHNDLIV